jgi:SAM-dependent methyltransferase
MSTGELGAVLACPVDHAPLHAATRDEWSGACGHRYAPGPHGFLELFAPDDPTRGLETVVAHCAPDQERGGGRLFDAYLRDWLAAGSATRVLDAGCGPATTVATMRAAGLDAYGVDLPGAARSWRAENADHLVCGNVAHLPFTDDAFDATTTIGVVEHVGTRTGHFTLAPDHLAQRWQFARELVRVTRPGGRILLSCPNKWFPIDVQHGPNDDPTRYTLRTRFFDRTGLNVHPVVGEYHLASYRDVGRWFATERWRALPLAGYFGFTAFERGGASARVAAVARAYVEHLPGALRRTPLNPYVLVEVTV